MFISLQLYLFLKFEEFKQLRNDVHKTMNINLLLDLNREELFAQLNSAYIYSYNGEKVWLADDIIDILSEKKIRDTRLINNFTEDEIVVIGVKTKVLRLRRFFTLKGIKRYLLEGKLFNVDNAYKYFNLENKNLEILIMRQIEKCVVNKKELTFNTKKTLKWLFEKRKQISAFDEIIDCRILLDWLESNTHSDKISEDKKKYLIKYIEDYILNQDI